MANRNQDPAYVRLQAGLTQQMCADVLGASRWSISRLDVKPFPGDDRPDAQDFVREKIAQLILEPAEESEYSMLQQAAAVLGSNNTRGDRLNALHKGTNLQEHLNEAVVRTTQQNIRLARAGLHSEMVDPLEENPHIAAVLTQAGLSAPSTEQVLTVPGVPQETHEAVLDKLDTLSDEKATLLDEKAKLATENETLTKQLADLQAALAAKDADKEPSTEGADPGADEKTKAGKPSK